MSGARDAEKDARIADLERQLAVEKNDTVCATMRETGLRNLIAELERQLAERARYAAYAVSCAKSGEHEVMDFDAFLVRSTTPEPKRLRRRGG